MATRRLNPTPAPARPGRHVEERATASVNATLSHRKAEHRSEHNEVSLRSRRFADGEHPAWVRVGAGMTVNMGDFNSLRIDVSISIPCLPSEIERAYEEASELTANYVASEQERWGVSGRVS